MVSCCLMFGSNKVNAPFLPQRSHHDLDIELGEILECVPDCALEMLI